MIIILTVLVKTIIVMKKAFSFKIKKKTYSFVLFILKNLLYENILSFRIYRVIKLR